MYNSFTNVSTVGSRELWGTWQEQTGVGKEKMLGHLWACGRPSSAGPRDLQTPTPPHPPTGSLAQSGEACHPLLGKRQLYPIPQFLGSDRNPPDFSRAAPHHLWAQLLSTLLAEVYGTILILTTGDLGCLFLLSNIFFR